ASPIAATRKLNTRVSRTESAYPVSLNRWMKLSNQTNLVLPPNASSVTTDRKSIWPDGQKKKTRVMTICGATSRYGSHRSLKVTRFSMVVVGPPPGLPHQAGEEEKI